MSNSNLEYDIRELLIARGIDPRGYTLDLPTLLARVIDDGQAAEKEVENLKLRYGEIEPPPMMADSEHEHALLNTVDAARWTDEFTALHDGDWGLMIGWFANAIETGRSHPDLTWTTIEYMRNTHDWHTLGTTEIYECKNCHDGPNSRVRICPGKVATE